MRGNDGWQCLCGRKTRGRKGGDGADGKMKEELVRTAMLLGEDGVEALKNKRVAVFGIGGVGGHATEALVRSGVGALDLIDNDVVSLSNLNRQIIATRDTVGRRKTEVMRERILSINPDCRVTCRDTFYLPEKWKEFPFAEYDYIVDAVDTVTAKIDLAVAAQEYGIPIISSMGTGNKLDPARLEIADIYETSICPLAKVMRRELKKQGVRKLTVVYSREEVRKPCEISGACGVEAWETGETDRGRTPQAPGGIPGHVQVARDTDGEACDISAKETYQERDDCEADSVKAPGRRRVPGSTAFVPAAAGLLLAGYVVRRLSGVDQGEGDGRV